MYPRKDYLPLCKITLTRYRGILKISQPKSNLEAGTLQSFLDDYLGKNKDVSIDYIHGEDVTAELGAINLLNTKKLKFPVELYEGSAEELPFENESFDTVVETLVFCSIKDPAPALREIKRVLKPGGIFIFIDHVKPEKERLASFVESINWVWHDMAGGCNLLNESHKEIEKSGLTIDQRGNTHNGILRWGIGTKT